MTVPPVAAAATTTGHAGEEVVAGRCSPEDVCRFLADVVPVVVADALGPLLPSGAGPVQVRLTRTKLKPGRKLTVSVDLSGEGIADRPATVTWWPGADPAVLVAPLDPVFPQIVDVYDPVRLAGILGDAGVTGFEDGLRVTPLRYRPGQRHVVRLENVDGGASLFAKCYRDSSGLTAVEASRSVAEALSACHAPARTARVAAYVTSHAIVLWAGEEGAPLSHVLLDESVRVSKRLDHVRRAGTALRAIHDGAGRSTAGGGVLSDPQAEAATTRRSLEHVAALAPGAAETAEALLSESVAALAELPDEQGHLLHGDYKCDNLLVSDDGLVLLDFDRVTTGDPAVDVGKLTSDLRWWSRVAGRSSGPVVDAFLYGYGPCPPTRVARALHYDVVFQLRAVGRRVPLHEPGWAAAVDEGLRAAGACALACSREVARQTHQVLGARAR